MKNTALAILISIAFHAALAAIVAAALSTYGERDIAEARLDLSKMDFSFSSEEDETLTEAVAALPQTPALKEPPKPPVSEPVEQPPPAPNGIAQPDDPKLPTPEENRNAVEMTPPPAPRQARIDAPPHPKSSIKPEYPAVSRERGEQGEVLLEISVDAAGAVSGVAVVSSSGFAALDDAAVKAVRRAKFVPAKSEGRAVSGRIRLTLAFRLKSR